MTYMMNFTEYWDFISLEDYFTEYWDFISLEDYELSEDSDFVTYSMFKTFNLQ